MEPNYSGEPDSCNCPIMPLPHSHLDNFDDGKSYDIKPDTTEQVRSQTCGTAPCDNPDHLAEQVEEKPLYMWHAPYNHIDATGFIWVAQTLVAPTEEAARKILPYGEKRELKCLGLLDRPMSKPEPADTDKLMALLQSRYGIDQGKKWYPPSQHEHDEAHRAITKLITAAEIKQLEWCKTVITYPPEKNEIDRRIKELKEGLE